MSPGLDYAIGRGSRGTELEELELAACKCRMQDYSSSGESSIQEKLEGALCWRLASCADKFGPFTEPFSQKEPYLCPCDKLLGVGSNHLELDK